MPAFRSDRSPLSTRLQLSSGKVAVFDFWATWCGPCRVISPIFEQLSEQVSGVEFYKIDVDEQTEISQEVGIRAVRSFFLIGHRPHRHTDLVAFCL